MTKKVKTLPVKKQVKSKKDNELVYLIAIPTIVFLLKMVTMINIKGGGWYGADGENYLKGVEGLVDFGFFSTEPKLSYWPAGYPLLMWPIAEATTLHFFYVMSILQSLFFAYSTYYFTNQLKRGPLKYLAVAVSLVVSLNPTLSLSTLSIGYEAPIASCFFMSLGLFYKFLHDSDSNQRTNLNYLFFSFAWLSLASFMQPRFLLIALLLLVLLAFRLSGWITRLKLISLSLVILMIAPTIMIYRNSQTIGQSVISTNLGVTMAIGAGPETSGSYMHKGPEVSCSSGIPIGELNDQEKVACVIKWYIDNPLKAINLAFNKSQYFWSPWSGPLADGTMARNPWLNISPAYTVIKNKEGAELVLGGFGKFVSYLWIIGQLVFLFLGYRRVQTRAKHFALLAITPILASWLISIGTIGDHRFRIPTMTLSLLFQVAGFLFLKEKITKKL